MKKIILTLIAVLATSLAGFSQITLVDAYSSLANLPCMKEKSITDVPLTSDAKIVNFQSVTCSATPSHNRQFTMIYESLPISNMLIGANNQDEMACVFTEPSDNGVYNILLLAGQNGGTMWAAYGQTTEAGLEAIRNCQVQMQGGNLLMAVAPEINLVNLSD